MEYILHIYDDLGRKVKKTYKSNDYDMLYGTLEDILEASEMLDEKGSYAKQIKMLKPIIKLVFPDITDEELKRVKVKDMNMIVTQALLFATTQINESGDGEKNAQEGK